MKRADGHAFNSNSEFFSFGCQILLKGQRNDYQNYNVSNHLSYEKKNKTKFKKILFTHVCMCFKMF